MKNKDIINLQIDKKNTIAGFSLVELVVTMGIAATLMVLASAILFSFLFTTNKIKIIQKMETDGNLVLSNIEALARNSYGVAPSMSCDNTPYSSLYLQDQNNNISSISLDNNLIFLYEDGTKSQLTSDEYQAQNLSFVCYQGHTGVQYLDINFDLKKGEGIKEDRETIIQNFSTGVTLRNTY